MHTHTYTHAQTHTHTRTRTRTHTCTHACALTHTQAVHEEAGRRRLSVKFNPGRDHADHVLQDYKVGEWRWEWEWVGMGEGGGASGN